MQDLNNVWQSAYLEGLKNLKSVSGLMMNNPIFILQDQMAGWVFDLYMQQAIKCYYWPAFIAGNTDNVMDLFKPQTYSICKP